MTHDEAMDLIAETLTVTVLSYDEAIAIYLRARGFLRDGSPVLGAPVPDDWAPEPVVKAVERVMMQRGVYDEVTGGRDAAVVASHHHVYGFRKNSETPVNSVVQEIAAERQRQIEVEGFDSEHDDCHSESELSAGAAAYALRVWSSHLDPSPNVSSPFWPSKFPIGMWKPGPARRMLVKAAAMLVAEIERLDRADAKGGEA